MKEKICILLLLSLLFGVGGVGAFFAQTTRNYNVFLRSNVGKDTMWDGTEIRVFGMTNLLTASPRIPAKTLYCNEGDTVILKVLNISQNEHHTVHLHGLDVNTRNDGDPMTSFWLEHMQDTTYTFIADHAGNYLYHCHVGDVVHVQMGMYGFIVVNAANETNTAYTGGPAFNKSYNWLLSEVDRSWHDTIPEHDPLMDTIHLPPYYPDYFLINGKSENQLQDNDSIKIAGAQNDFIYLRIGSIGFYYNRIIFPAFLNAIIIDSDGRPLPAAISNDTLEIAPGERYGVMLNPSAQLNSAVEVQYINMNTDSIWNSQYVPVNISGFSSESEILQPGNNFEIIPNPNEGVFEMLIPESFCHEPGSCTLVIRDVAGRIVFQHAISFSRTTLSLDLEEGMYFSAIISNGINTRTLKMAVCR